MYDLPSLIPVLLSHGADPNIQTSRGNLTPLHLACGAGNDTIVELLVRHGCELDIHDCFGSSPCDHAIRNGFSNVAEYLEAQIIKERAIRKANSTNTNVSPKSETSTTSEGYEQDKFLLQSAFSNLTLKDKLIFNMMVRKRGRASVDRKPKNPTIVEGNEDSAEDEEVVIDSCGDTRMNDTSNVDIPKIHAERDNELYEVESVDSVLTDTDKESLDIAMKLMNKEVRRITK